MTAGSNLASWIFNSSSPVGNESITALSTSSPLHPNEKLKRSVYRFASSKSSIKSRHAVFDSFVTSTLRSMPPRPNSNAHLPELKPKGAQGAERRPKALRTLFNLPLSIHVSDKGLLSSVKWPRHAFGESERVSSMNLVTYASGNSVSRLL